MIKYLQSAQIIKQLRCPFDQTFPLKYTSNYLSCPHCRKKFPIKDHIIGFVDPKTLDIKTRRELKGNNYKLDKRTIEKYAFKDKMSSYHQYCSDKKFDLLINSLNKINADGIISLGSGTGFELKKILQKKPYKLIFSSDLSFTATKIVPFTLENFDVSLCLFTSDLRMPPVIPDKKMPILVYEAMHHTEDIHLTLEEILKNKYKHIFFVEPTTNFIVKILARFGLAQRVEYSGVKPDFLDMNKLRKLCKKYNYNLTVNTVWEFPEDYFNKILKGNVFFESIFFTFIDLISWFGNIFKIGSMSVVYLKKDE